MASSHSAGDTGTENNNQPMDAKTDTINSPAEPMLTSVASNVYSTFSESPSSMKSAVTLTEPNIGSDWPEFTLPTHCPRTGLEKFYAGRSPFDGDKRVKLKLMMKNRHSFQEKVYLKRHQRLRIAVTTNNIASVQSCLRTRADPNYVDLFGRSPLHLASCSGYSEIVSLLLENGANPNMRDKLGNTPLHLAACTNNIAVVTLLLKAGTDVCSSDQHGRSPLQLAQSKLKLLQRHMHSNGTAQATSPAKHDLQNLYNIPIHDNSYVAKEALQIVEMMKLYLQKRGQDTEAELLDAFSSRLTLSETKEQVRDLLDSLSNLSLDSSNVSQKTNSASFSGNSIISDANSSLAVFSNAPSQSAPTNFFMSSTCTSTPATDQKLWVSA